MGGGNTTGGTSRLLFMAAESVKMARSWAILTVVPLLASCVRASSALRAPARHPLNTWRSPHCRKCRSVHIVCCDDTAGNDEPSLEGQWRLERVRLDEQWSASVRARKRKFLPFSAARQ